MNLTLKQSEDTINKIMQFAVREGVDCTQLRVDHQLFSELQNSEFILSSDSNALKLVLSTPYGKVEIISRGNI